MEKYREWRKQIKKFDGEPTSWISSETLRKFTQIKKSYVSPNSKTFKNEVEIPLS